MPAGVTASNIRNNRKKHNQQQEVAFAAGSESKAPKEVGSLNGSEEFLGRRRRVGIIITFLCLECVKYSLSITVCMEHITVNQNMIHIEKYVYKR